MKRLLSITTLALVAASAAFGQIVYSGGTYTQDFNTLSSSGTANTWTNDVTIDGWFATQGTYRAAAGNETNGAMYSFGAAGNGERALGSIASNALGAVGTVAVRTGASFTNNMGGDASFFVLQYVGEQWRNGGNINPHSLTFEYSLDATSLTTGTWTAVSALDFVGPVATASAGQLNGNLAANQVALNQSVTLSSNWLAGSNLWIRWNDLSDPNSDHGLAIDDVSFTSRAQPVPEPATLAALGIGAVALLRRRNKK